MVKEQSDLVEEQPDLVEKQPDQKPELSLVDIHMAFDKIQKRIQNLAQLLSIFPEGLAKMKELRNSNTSHALMSASELVSRLFLVHIVCPNTCGT